MTARHSDEIDAVKARYERELEGKDGDRKRIEREREEEIKGMKEKYDREVERSEVERKKMERERDDELRGMRERRERERREWEREVEEVKDVVRRMEREKRELEEDGKRTREELAREKDIVDQLKVSRCCSPPSYILLTTCVLFDTGNRQHSIDFVSDALFKHYHLAISGHLFRGARLYPSRDHLFPQAFDRRCTGKPS